MKRKQKPLITQYIESCQQKAKVAEEVYRGWQRVRRRWLREERAELLAIKGDPGRQTEFLVRLAIYIRNVLQAKFEPTISGKLAARLYLEAYGWGEEVCGSKELAAKLF
jgi:hypothetical protein